MRNDFWKKHVQSVTERQIARGSLNHIDLGISVARIRSTFKDGFVIGLVLAGVGYAVASFTLPSGWRFFPQLLFNEGTTVLLVILIIAGIAGKFKGNRGLAGLIAGVIICFYLAGGISIMANG